MTRSSRPVSWLKAALKDFQDFPAQAQEEAKFALAVAAEGGKAEIAKPMHGLGSGVFEIALAHRGDVFRVVYAVQLGDSL
jgi:phage-related protein